MPSSPNEVDAKPAVCATPLKYPVTLPVTSPVTFPVTLPVILPTKLVEVVTPVTTNPPAVICASSVKVAIPDTTIPVEFVSNFAALTSPVKSPMKVVAVTTPPTFTSFVI